MLPKVVHNQENFEMLMLGIAKAAGSEKNNMCETHLQ